MKQGKFPKCNFKNITILFLVLSAISLVMSRAFFMNPDSDMWWMMATGRYIIENHSFPQINPFVIHDDFQIIIQQWLLAVVNYTMYSSFGKAGLVFLSVMVYFTMIYLLWKYTGLFSCSIYERVAAVVIVGLIGTFYITTRPTIFTICILLLQQIAVLKYEQSKKHRWLCVLPFLSLIEINIHASIWPFFFVLLLPHIVPWVFTTKQNLLKQAKEKLIYLLPITVSILVGFINPYGIKGMTYLFLSYNSSQLFQIISELQEPGILSTNGISVIATIILLVLYLNKEKSNVKGYKVYMAAGTVILASMHLRNKWFILFGLVTLICSMNYTETIARWIKITLLTPKDKNKLPKSKKKEMAELIISAVAYTITLIVFTLLLYEPLKNTFNPQPVAAVEYLNGNTKPEEVIIYTPFNVGGYLEWSGYKVYMDARPELYAKKVNKKEDVAAEYMKVYEGNADYGAFIDKYNFTHLLVEKDGIFRFYMQWIQDADYHIVAEDKFYILYERNE